MELNQRTKIAASVLVLGLGVLAADRLFGQGPASAEAAPPAPGAALPPAPDKPQAPRQSADGKELAGRLKDLAAAAPADAPVADAFLAPKAWFPAPAKEKIVAEAKVDGKEAKYHLTSITSVAERAPASNVGPTDDPRPVPVMAIIDGHSVRVGASFKAPQADGSFTVVELVELHQDTEKGTAIIRANDQLIELELAQPNRAGKSSHK